MTRQRFTLTALVLSLLLAAPAAGAEVALTLANDALAPREHVDDLYTSDTQLAIYLGRYRVQVGERMFTDRSRELRFDETALEVSRPLPRFGRWRGEAGLGVLHVGRGLLGESVQNTVHSALGSSEVDLEYAADHELYGRARVDLWRPLVERPGLDLRVHVSSTLIPGFDSHLRVGLETERTLGAGFSLLAGVAGLAHHVETDLLEDVIAERSTAWNVGVAWRNIVVGYGYNLYGTDTGHLTLSYHFTNPIARRVGASSPAREGHP